MMNVQEMETATRLGLPVDVVVWVDGAYGVIGWKQERRFGRTHAIEFGNPGWADLARAFGWSHRHATDGAAVGEALGAAHGRGRPGARHGPHRLPPERPARQPGGAGAGGVVTGPPSR